MADAELDPESVDRAFAEMVARYDLTADRPDPQPAREQPVAGEPPAVETGPAPRWVERSWAADLPPARLDGPPAAREPHDEPAAPYVPEPLPPLARPGMPALLGWIGIAFSALVVLAAGFGLDLPVWVGWLAVGSFVCGFGVLLTQLPRHRPPEAGDGAVL